MIIRYAKCRETAITPTRGHPSDAGWDVYFCPDNMDPSVSSVKLMPGESHVFPTGIKAEIPHGYVLLGANRSGMAAKRNIMRGAQVIDAGYSGEIFVDLHNLGNEPQVITPGTKICQLIMVPVIPFRAIEVDESALYDEPLVFGNRGEGKLGSTGDNHVNH